MGRRLALRPPPVQRPRIPIWVSGGLLHRGPRARALRWDGSCLYRVTPPAWEDVTADDVRALRAEAPPGFTIAVGGRRPREDENAERAYHDELREAGTDWWHEYLPPSFELARVRAHIARGPLV